MAWGIIPEVRVQTLPAVSDKGGGGGGGGGGGVCSHPDPEIRGVGLVSKKIFSTLLFLGKTLYCHSTLLYIQLRKREPANLMLVVALQWTGILSKGGI